MIAVKYTCKYSPKIWQATYNAAKKGAKSDVEKFMTVADCEITRMVRNYAKNVHDYNDFSQQLRESVLKIVRTKKEPVKNAQNYFMHTIKCDIKQMLKNATKERKRCQLVGKSEFLFDEKQAKISTAGMFSGSGMRKPAEYCYLKEVLEVISHLPKKVQAIILAPVYGKEKTSVELGKKLGLTPANVDKIRERTRKILRDVCEYDKK